MLTFLRKIRKSLIEDGSTRKYIIYAIGEIALVVIGILIALQINNWNEWRKEREDERKLLKEVAATLGTNYNLLNSRLKRIALCNQSGDIVLSIIDRNAEYSDTLDNHFWRAFYNVSKVFLSEAGYQPMKYSEGKIILNEDLKNEIVNLFEVNYQYLLRQLEWGVKDDPEIHPFIDEQFMRAEGENLKPFNFEAISDSNILYALLMKAKSQRTWFEMLISDSQEETRRVLQLIQTELDAK